MGDLQTGIKKCDEAAQIFKAICIAQTGTDTTDILPGSEISRTRDDFYVSLPVPQVALGNRGNFFGGSVRLGNFGYKQEAERIYSRKDVASDLAYLSSFDGATRELRVSRFATNPFSPDGISSSFDLLAGATTKLGKDGDADVPYVGALISLGAAIYAVRPDPWEKRSGFFLRFEPAFGIGGGVDIANNEFDGYFDFEGRFSALSGFYF